MTQGGRTRLGFDSLRSFVLLFVVFVGVWMASRKALRIWCLSRYEKLSRKKSCCIPIELRSNFHWKIDRSCLLTVSFVVPAALAVFAEQMRPKSVF